jgi:hypothetical protein
MHRSGTSLAMRLLNLLGVDVGPPEGLMPAVPGDNPKGYWENEALSALNDDLLAALGGTWSRPPVFAPGWQRNPVLGPLRERAVALLRDEFGDAELWGWKDPRTSLTLPFWRDVAPPLRCAICIRHPAEVAASLARRDDMPVERTYSSWLAHYTAVIVATRELPRIVVAMERIFEDLTGELARLAAFIEAPERAADASVLAAADEFVDADLRHHRASARDELPQTASQLYELLLEASRQPFPEPAGATAALDELAATLHPLVLTEVDQRRQAEHAREARDDLASRLDTANDEIDLLGRRLALTEEARVQTETYAREGTELRERIERSLQETEARLGATEARLAASEKELTRYQSRRSVRFADALLPPGSRRHRAYERVFHRS